MIFQRTSYSCPIHRKIMAINKNNSPRVTNIEAQSEVGLDVQYNQTPPAKTILPPINKNILITLRKYIHFIDD